jgi:hypothetical protein
MESRQHRLKVSQKSNLKMHLILARCLGGAGASNSGHKGSSQQRIVPHGRTLRNAGEQAKQMVASGISTHRIRSYLSQWCSWWNATAECWTKQEILTWFLEACWDLPVKTIAQGLMNQISPESHVSEVHNSSAILALA